MSKYYNKFEYVKQGPSETKKTLIVDPKEGIKTISDYAKDKDFPAKVIRTLQSNGGPILKGGQKKLDVDGDGKITGKDFAMLKNKKKPNKKKPSMMAMAMKGKK